MLLFVNILNLSKVSNPTKKVVASIFRMTSLKKIEGRVANTYRVS